MNRKRIYTGAAAALLLLFSACEMMGPETGTGSNPDGKAAVRINIETAGVQGRTVMPTVGLGDVAAWKLWGGKDAETETLLKDFSGAGATVYLETGTWDFTLKGYNNSNAVILQGVVTDRAITLEGPNDLSFTVTPVMEGSGSFKISINLPAGHGITGAKVFEDGAEIAEAAPVDNPMVFESDYAVGDHYFSVRLYKDGDLYGVVSELVRVWGNLRSEKTYTLTLEDLKLTYVIDYTLNDGQFGESVENPGCYRSTDVDVTLPVPTRTGYTFGGWYEAADFSGTAVTGIPQGSTGDRAFYAKWTAITYNITYQLNGGTNGANPASYTVEDLPIDLAEPSRGGCIFGGWYEDAEFNGTAVSSIPLGGTGNKTFYAKWTIITYYLLYQLNGGTNGANPSTYTVEDLPIDLADPSCTGHTFRGWYEDAEFNGTAVSSIPLGSTGSKIFYALWEINTYTVEYDANGGSGTTASSDHTYDELKNLTPNGFTRTGYTFTGWNTAPDGAGQNYTNGQSVKNLTTAKGVTVTLYAKWRLDITFNITVWVNEDDGDILVSNNNVTISKSGSGSFTATVESGYSGIQWYWKGAPLSGTQGTAQSITINAADYDNGTHFLGVRVIKDGIPYSTDIRFTVTN